ncbi:unnamed protein product [Cyprideis torosa]|uniref:Uncharacterized protein n=1 Tax=Cyprideis torosa TaxID=163714 RepID=A0A7R8ZTK7_9CRUS|nr:unnamed protein product [Cyprideis torosa]CAG0904282.1 unnamed protein product [Cyprideis torosa]
MAGKMNRQVKFEVTPTKNSAPPKKAFKSLILQQIREGDLSPEEQCTLRGTVAMKAGQREKPLAGVSREFERIAWK